MSEADEMLKKLGYILDYEDVSDYEIDTEVLRARYIRKIEEGEIYIDFWDDKTFSKTEHILCRNTSYITMQELQAINEKCKELGWIE